MINYSKHRYDDKIEIDNDNGDSTLSEDDCITNECNPSSLLSLNSSKKENASY